VELDVSDEDLDDSNEEPSVSYQERAVLDEDLVTSTQELKPQLDPWLPEELIDTPDTNMSSS
jgi:hypothetical protein